MNKDFNFENIGKREPYKIPGGFFPDLEERIVRTASPATSCRRLTWRAAIAGTAAAAAVAVIGFSLLFAPLPPGHTMEEVEQVFAQLRETDRDFLLETYQDSFLY